VADEGEQPPRSVEAFECVIAPIVEGRVTAQHQVADSGRDEDSSVIAGLFDPRRKVHRDPGDVAVVSQLDLTGVKPAAYLQPDGVEGLSELAREREGARWRVESDKKAVARALDDRSAVTVGRAPGDAVVVIEQATPRLVASGGRTGRRADDVGEHHSLDAPLSLRAGRDPTTNSMSKSTMSCQPG
jgi:hypothetical protein